ncbi:Mg2+ transporter protein, CorA-like protein [Sporosarcina sp. P16a]|uniref:magnesium transporter CorA family protein n=1 Tax=unclassified Sporosarcina TaxID=2647733 RepID=UPI000C170F2B|nr:MULTISPECIES: magnesium transporter CorA family protein [unclassified Sporosarcina]PIC67588.1 Mg2+ transporter protein, CorA-like protein [Sporosarcina sp. P16a]PIC93039.1 Mg2+ transporter protein, CorA-like protein [Sporosarcina sp. P25]
MEPIRANKNWTWVRMDEATQQEISEFPDLPSASKRWAMLLSGHQNSNLEMDASEEGQEAMWGSIVYSQNVEIRSEKKMLHYYLTKDTLLTYGMDTSFFKDSEQKVLKYMDKAENAIEGFMVLIGEITSVFLRKIEYFEDQMHDLLWSIKAKNDEPVFDQIMDNRYEILVWKNLVIPFMEIQEATVEAFGETILEGSFYKRTCRRINRCHQTIREYNEEIGHLIDLESIISSHRGNEIVKTLTVITMFFTPVAAWGALWGMNFDVMPELKWKYGYLGAIIVIGLSTWGLYYYLKKKNWIGSVLKNSKDEKF